ncbi:PfkB family carbohydrate kinase [Massilia pinisoli]|uniref:PfkB family carbohydrate kinase n=1 Tax=Massilia pinisoli TaxID=1772194 RepID=A0ABT1ZTR7_9BURK|nr:PfkB family carbohydrate kinase [Massilia pinisoli]MCS0583285.1 PfkB family carbohydrate kinase [Massilia pinisoli]
MVKWNGMAVVFGEVLVEEGPSAPVVGGAPFNVARHLAAFMAPPLLITRIGDDRNGAAVRAELERFVIPDAGLQVDPMEETGRAVAERHGGAPRLALLPRQAYDFIDPQAAAAAVADGGHHDTVYFGTLVQREERSRLALTAVLDATAALRFLDLNLRPGQATEAIVTKSLTMADVLKVNEEELQALFQWYFQIGPNDAALSQDEVHAACRALMDRFSLQALIVTLGHRGSVYFGADGSYVATRDNPVPPFVIDTAGAGDAFSAVFMLGRARGWPLETTLARANEFAGAICAVSGAVPGDMGFYDKWVARWRETAA